MKKYRFNALLVMALVTLTAIAVPKKSILSLKESITDSAIVYPYSFETNTQELMKNWYLQNYTELDKDVENKASGDVSDSEYIRRLKAIPSGVELPYNQVVRSYIERYTKRNRTLVSQMLGMSPYYMPIFEQALEKEGMPLELKYIPIIESALDPNAVSPVGASGLWQFMLETAKGVGLEVNSLVDERRDPYRSSECAVSYFKQLYNIYGNWSLAIAAYNCGPNNVNKALRRAKGNSSQNPDFWEIYDYLPRETRGYVPAFIAATYVMNYYQDHNISPSLAKKPLLIDTVKVSRRINLNQIAQVLNIPIDEIRILNPQYRHDVIPGDTHPYTLALPSQQIYSFIMVEDSISKYRPELYATHDVREPGTVHDAPTTFEPNYDDITVISSATEDNVTTSIDESSGNLHKVRKGESMRSIADDHGMTVDELMALNNLTSKRVHRGQVLKIAGKTSPAASDNNRRNENLMTSKSSSDKTFNATPAQEASQVSDKPVRSKPVQEDKPASNPAVQATTGTSTYTPYKGSYSIDDEITTTSSERTARKRQRATQESAAAEKNTSEKVDMKEKPAATPRKSSSRRVQDIETKQQEQKTSRKSSRRSQKAEPASDENTTSKRTSRNRRKKAQQAQEEKPTNAVVKRGDTLEKIAQDNGVSVDELRDANPQIKGRHIRPGDKLDIPGKSTAGKKSSSRKKRAGKAKAEEEKPIVHNVKSGESLERIARRNGVTMKELRKANPQLKGDMIKPGDNVKIPRKGKSSKSSTTTPKRRKRR